MIKTTTVRCVLGHEYEVEDEDQKIRIQGYTRCQESQCKRNAFTVRVRTQDDGSIEDDMKHLDESATCPHCGGHLTGGNP